MPAAADRYKQLMSAGKPYSADNIGNPGTARNQSRYLIYRPVKHPTSHIEIIITWTEQFAPQIRSKLVDSRFLKIGTNYAHMVICCACIFWLRHAFSLLLRRDEHLPKV